MPNVRSKVRNARMLWVRESEFGVPNLGSVSAITPALAAIANPGASSLTFASDPASEIDAGDVISVYRPDKDDMEFYKVGAGYTSGASVALDASTPVIFRRDVGYSAQKHASIAGFKRVPGFIGTTLVPDIPLLESMEINGNKGIQDVRGDLVRIAGDINLQIGIANSGGLLRDMLNSVYYQDAPLVSPAENGALDGAHSAGATQITVASVTSGWVVGNVFKIDDGIKSELVKAHSTWNGSDTTIPLDPTTPLMYAHATTTAVKKVTTPYTHIVDRGDAVPSNAFLVQFQDSGVICLFRGVKFNVMNMTVNPNNGLINVGFSCIAKAVQIMDSYIFGAPTTYAHKPFTNWETTIIQDGSVLPRVQEHTITLDNQLETDGFEEGSRFIGTADEDKGRAEGSFNYKFFDATRIKDIYFEQERALRFVTQYKGGNSNGEAFEVMYPKARFGGPAFPQVPASGFVNNTNNVMGLYDSVTGTDVRFKITNLELRLA